MEKENKTQIDPIFTFGQMSAEEQNEFLEKFKNELDEFWKDLHEANIKLQQEQLFGK